MTSADFRVSDADRQQVMARLQHHTAAGRLSLDEYAERVDRTLAARTRADLAAVTGDLPAEPPPDRPAATGQLGMAFLLAVIALMVLGGLLLLGR